MALLSINGVEVLAPTSYSVGIQEISKAERNANGLMIKDRIATKVKLEFSWDVIDPLELSKILSLVDNNFFNATYLDPQSNSKITKTFYAGDRSMEGMLFKDGIMTWKGFKFNIVER